MACKIDLKTFSKFSTIIGAFIIALPTGIPWFYGNLSPYLISYFRFHIGLDTASEQADWFVPTFSITAATSILTLDFLVDKFSLRWMHLAALLTFDFGMFLTYFTVQHSVGLTVLTFTGICGFAAGQIAGISLMYVPRSMPEHVGVASAFVSCGFGLGAIFINFIVTAYINPDNLTPNVRQKDMAYFSQQRLIHNVPAVFLVIGTVAICLNVLGFCLEQMPAAALNSKMNISLLSTINENTHVKMSHSKYYDANDSLEEGYAAKENVVPSTVLNGDASKDGPQILMKEDSSLKPYEILRTRSFYQVWICVAVLSYSALVNTNYYKLFGQLWIKDDSFLSLMSSVAAVSMALIRVAFGFIIDKAGVKNTLILALFMNAILMSFWYLTPRVDRWFYLIFFQVLNSVHGLMYIVFPMSALKLFGPRYYATNYGLIMTALLLISLVTPTLFPILLDKTGWFGLIFVGGAGSLLAMLSVMLVMSPEQKI